MFRSVVLACLCVLAVPVFAQAKKTQRKPNPAFQPPEVQEDLPNVLLIGDSISIGYMLATRKELEGEANVWRPPTNCGPSTRGLEQLESWLALGNGKWDVIHWNFGLHDLKYLGPNGENLADPNAAGSRQQVPIEQYKKNLRKIATRLKKTGAKVIGCDTTPVPEGAKGRVVGDSKRYNEAAAEVMANVGDIEIDPLYKYAMNVAKMQKPANVHYTPEGSAKLAEQVATSVRCALTKQQ